MRFILTSFRGHRLRKRVILMITLDITKEEGRQRATCYIFERIFHKNKLTKIKICKTNVFFYITPFK